MYPIFKVKFMTDKVSRGLKIDKHMDDMLQRVCEARGVTINSWLLNVVGEAIYKANAQERLEKATIDATQSAMKAMVDLMGGSVEND